MEEYEESSDSLSDLEVEDVEDEYDYKYGGYHRVHIGEIFNKKYRVKSKLGWGHFSTVWLVEYFPPESNKTFSNAESINSSLFFPKLKEKEIKTETKAVEQEEQNEKMLYGALKVVRSAPKYTETANDEVIFLKTISENDPDRKYFCLHLIDSFTHRGLNGIHTCMVTDVGGSNLLSLIKLYHYKGIPISITKEISRQVLIALNYLHTRCSLIHTDLKPENVLLNFTIGHNGIKHRKDVPDSNHIKVLLADFGNANWIHKRYTNDIQTRQYRCPEVMLGLHWDCPSDIWSMGCMLFELLTGDYLFSPRETERFSKVDDHFALFMELLGPIPKDMIDASSVRSKYFTSDYELKRIPNKRLAPRQLEKVLNEKYKMDMEQAVIVSDLIKSMLVYDENKRATAAQCLKHPWFK